MTSFVMRSGARRSPPRCALRPLRSEYPVTGPTWKIEERVDPRAPVISAAEAGAAAAIAINAELVDEDIADAFEAAT